MTPRTEPPSASARTGTSSARTAHSKRFLLARITAPRATTERARPPVNLAIVLDRSGSMSGEKLRVAKAAVEEAIARLQPGGPVQRRRLRRCRRRRHRVDVGVGEARRGAVERLRVDRGPRQHEPRGGLAARLRAGRGPSRRAGRQPLPAPDRRARQRRASRTASSWPAMPRSCVPGASRRRPSGSATTSTSGCSRGSPTPAAATSTTSPTRRRSATRSRPRSARRSRSSPATSRSRSPRATTSGSSRSARTGRRRAAIGRSISLGDLGSEQVVEVVLRLSFPYGTVGQETGAIVALTDRDGVFGSGGAGEARRSA